MEVVLPDGSIWHGLRTLFKDNMGYALRHLFAGAEGTLGIITAASFRLFPKPAGVVAMVAAVPSIDAACTLYARLRTVLGPELVACEMFTRPCLDAVVRHVPSARDPFAAPHPVYVLIEVASFEDDAHARSRGLGAMAALMADAIITDAVISENNAQFRALWGLREHISEAQGAGRPVIKHDIALPLSKIAEFSSKCEETLSWQFPQCRVENFGHLGDGNLHFNIVPCPLIPHEAFHELTGSVNMLVHDMVTSFSGSISAEHGLGVLRRDEAARYMPSAQLNLLKAIKTAIDPAGRMNPGKLLANQSGLS
jgi:FAD/FMN-containing dehydrogenase